MPFQKREHEPRFSRDSGPVFGIGRRLFVHCEDPREPRASLGDEKDGSVVGVLDDGTAVEIVAWMPRGVATRYFVRAIGSEISGWLGRSQLRDTAERRSATAPAARAAPSWIPVRQPTSSRVAKDRSTGESDESESPPRKKKKGATAKTRRVEGGS